MASDKKILVVDVPESATTEEAEQLLNAPYDRNYYLDKLTFTWAGIGARAFYRLRSKPEKGASAA
jgi:hypothetical protein